MKKQLKEKRFIEKVKKIHGDKYDYSLVDYVNNFTKVKILCIKHGVFEQTPSNHINHKCGCPMCGNKMPTINEFIVKASEIHNNKYDYSLVKYKNSFTKVKIVCPTHGIFETTPNMHCSNKSGCPNCNSSKGEMKIKSFLLANNILFEEQKTFKGCKRKTYLRFDFYLPEYNTCVEYQGRQHYEAVDCFGGEKHLNDTKERDAIKRVFCGIENIKLLYIKFDENVEEALTHFYKKE